MIGEQSGHQEASAQERVEVIKSETRLVIGGHWNGGTKIPDNGSVWARDVVEKVEAIKPTTIIPDGLPGQWCPVDNLITRRNDQFLDYAQRGMLEFLRVIPVKNPFKFLEPGEKLRIINADIGPDFLGFLPADFPNTEKKESDRYLEEEVAMLVRKSDPFFDQLSYGEKTSEWSEAEKMLKSAQEKFTSELRLKKTLISAGLAMPLILSSMAIMASVKHKKDKERPSVSRRQFIKFGVGAAGAAVASSIPWAIPTPDSSRDATMREDNGQTVSDILNQIEELAKPESSNIPMIDVRNAVIGLANLCDARAENSGESRCIVLGSMHSHGPLPIRRHLETDSETEKRLIKVVEKYLDPLIKKAMRFYYKNKMYAQYPEVAVANLFVNIFATYGIMEIPQLAPNQKDPTLQELAVNFSGSLDISGGPNSMLIDRTIEMPDHQLDSGRHSYYSWSEKRNPIVADIIQRLVDKYSAKG